LVKDVHNAADERGKEPDADGTEHHRLCSSDAGIIFMDSPEKPVVKYVMVFHLDLLTGRARS
jgi:hypothetical protein